MKQLVKVKRNQLKKVLRTQELEGYFYWDYWEFCSAHFVLLKTYPAGTLSLEELDAEMELLYAQCRDTMKEHRENLHPCVTVGIYIGYFDDDEEDFHIVGSRWPTAEEFEEDMRTLKS